MDAKVDDWVVTPRRGKAVEINALWYNALSLLRRLAARGGRSAGAAGGRSARRAHANRSTRGSGTRRAATCTTSSTASRATTPRAGRTRSLRSRSTTRCSTQARWRPVFDVVRERLLTPVGLRSLAPGHRDYKAQYYGDLRARDAAYHQGTVWALARRPVRRRVAQGASGRHGGRARCLDRLRSPPERGGRSARSARSSTPKPPYTPRGCIAQAWSVAEVLRAWLLTETPNPKPTPKAALELGVGIGSYRDASCSRACAERLDLLAVLRPVAGALRVDRALVMRLRLGRQASRAAARSRACGRGRLAPPMARPADSRRWQSPSAAARGPVASPPNSRASAASSVCSITI